MAGGGIAAPAGSMTAMGSARRGFTLLELLVATAIFVAGFTACAGMFLLGVRFRRQADDTMRLALAGQALTSELSIDAGVPAVEGSAGTLPRAPSAYVGDGRADADAPSATESAAQPVDLPLFPLAGMPGVWYRVMAACDFAGGDDAGTPVLRLRLAVVSWPYPATALTFGEIDRRLRLGRGGDPDAVLALLVQRASAVDRWTTLPRRPHWQP